MDPLTGATWGTLSRADEILHFPVLGAFDTTGEYDWTVFDVLKQRHFESARLPVFHYVISADEIGVAPLNYGGISRGIGASDFIVSLGGFGGSPPQVAQAGTFMHELGRNLGLRHGGRDDVNYKPNYLSVMNYSFGLAGLQIGTRSRLVDYSRYGNDVVPPLDEAAHRATRRRRRRPRPSRRRRTPRAGTPATSPCTWPRRTRAAPASRRSSTRSAAPRRRSPARRRRSPSAGKAAGRSRTSRATTRATTRRRTRWRCRSTGRRRRSRAPSRRRSSSTAGQAVPLKWRLHEAGAHLHATATDVPSGPAVSALRKDADTTEVGAKRRSRRRRRRRARRTLRTGTQRADAGGVPVTRLALAELRVRSLPCATGVTPDLARETTVGARHVGDGMYHLNLEDAGGVRRLVQDAAARPGRGPVPDGAVQIQALNATFRGWAGQDSNLRLED
jgi:hypothetical protein